MYTEKTSATEDLVELTADIVAAYISRNSIGPSALPDLLASVHGALIGLGASTAAPETEKPVPPVPVKKSVTPDYIISLEDGRRYKSMKRHLKGRGMTPDEYRTKWGLPPDYPMVAASYSAQRSELAKSMGLGRKRVEAAPDARASRRKRV